jgi:hypothetical protein
MGASKEEEEAQKDQREEFVNVTPVLPRPVRVRVLSADTAEVLFAQPIRLYSRRDQEEGGGESSQTHSYCKVIGYGSREPRCPSNDRRRTTKYICCDFGHFESFFGSARTSLPYSKA